MRRGLPEAAQRRLLPALLLALAAPFLLAGSASQEVVERFVKACNKQDAQAIAELFHPDAVLWKLGEQKPDVSGRDRLRNVFLERFHEHPKAKVKVAARMELGPWLVVHERTDLEPGEPAREMLAVFEVADGLIRREWVMEKAAEAGDDLGGEGPVALQIEKWNEKDLPRLIALYQESASLLDLSSGEPLAAGQDALRDRFQKIFEASPRLHTEVLERMALGPWVVYRERARTDSDDKQVDSIAIYEVRDGLIRRIWYAR